MTTEPRIVICEAGVARGLVDPGSATFDPEMGPHEPLPAPVGLLSLRNRGEPVPRFVLGAACPTLALAFDDVLYDKPEHGYSAATLDDVRAIVSFGRRGVIDRGLVVIHCAAGLSRSPAAALIALAASRAEASEHAVVGSIVDDLAWARSKGLREDGALPNALLVVIGDLLLGRRGRLVRAACVAWPLMVKNVERILDRTGLAPESDR